MGAGRLFFKQRPGANVGTGTDPNAVQKRGPGAESTGKDHVVSQLAVDEGQGGFPSQG